MLSREYDLDWLLLRLAEDDKDGVMAEKVLKLFWSLAHSQDVTIEIMDQVPYSRKSLGHFVATNMSCWIKAKVGKSPSWRFS